MIELERTVKESIIDRLLLLYVIARTRQKGYNITGDVKLQKLLYKAEESMYLEGYKGLNYNFVRWEHGPFSQEVYVDTRDLIETGFLRSSQGKAIDVSDQGVQLIEALQEILSRNRKFEQIIDRVINEFGPYKGQKCKAVVYSYPKVGEKKPIKKVRKGEFILQKLENSEAKDRFWIDEKWFETLEVLFDPASYKSIKEGLKALKEEEGRPFVPVVE